MTDMEYNEARLINILVTYLRVIATTPNAELLPKKYLYDLVSKECNYSPGYVGNVVRAAFTKHTRLMTQAKAQLNLEKTI